MKVKVRLMVEFSGFRANSSVPFSSTLALRVEALFPTNVKETVIFSVIVKVLINKNLVDKTGLD